MNSMGRRMRRRCGIGGRKKGKEKNEYKGSGETKRRKYERGRQIKGKGEEKL